MDSSSDEEPEVEDTIAGFAFGNVDRNGKLENQVLSELDIKKLDQIKDIPGVKQIEKIKNKPDQLQQSSSINYTPGKKAPDALNYEAEDEMIEYDEKDQEAKDLAKRQKKYLTKSYRTKTLGEQRAKHYDDYLEKKVEETDIKAEMSPYQTSSFLYAFLENFEYAVCHFLCPIFFIEIQIVCQKYATILVPF